MDKYFLILIAIAIVSGLFYISIWLPIEIQNKKYEEEQAKKKAIAEKRRKRSNYDETRFPITSSFKYNYPKPIKPIVRKVQHKGGNNV